VQFALRELPLAVLLGPVCVLAVLVFAVPYRAVDAIATRRSIEHEIQATVKVMGGAIVHALWIVLLVVFAWAGWGAFAGVGAAVGFPALGIAGLFALERETAAWRAVRTWWAFQRLSPAAARGFARAEAELAALLDEAHAWVTTSSSLAEGTRHASWPREG
jgi:4-hydroxybenzoate polyprenyltransferase